MLIIQYQLQMMYTNMKKHSSMNRGTMAWHTVSYYRTKLVQQDQGVWSGMLQDGRCLTQLNKEGALPCNSKFDTHQIYS